MPKAAHELWTVFWEACKETPRGMYAPFAAFWKAAVHNQVLDHRRLKLRHTKLHKKGEDFADHCTN